MKPTKPKQLKSQRKLLKVGIVDLIEKQPSNSLYTRIVNPNYTSIMPQTIAVWVEQMGHEVYYATYTGLEDLRHELPDDIDILFICAFTHGAYLAYCISNLFRQKNVVTVLGGPHARAYAEDASNYFDYVVGLTDKELIRDLLQDFSPNPWEGVMLSAKQQPQTLPGVRERWKFIQQALDKTRFIHVIPVIGSLGCPYKCSYCIDSQVDFQPLSYDQIREDLIFLQEQPKPPAAAWYDPNFGVRFEEYMDAIESVVKPGKLVFLAESTLSLLSEPRLKRLKKNNFLVMLPGIESWFDYNNKSGQRKNTGMEKVKSVAELVKLITQYIPYVQTNFIFGLDSDTGPLPFELTKKFIDLTPGVFPNYSLLTAYGNSAPLNYQYQVEGRVIDAPFPYLDGYSALNVRLKNYSYLEFYDYMIDLAKFTFSAGMIWKRFKANKHPVTRWMNLLRGVYSEKGGDGNYAEIRHRLATDDEFKAFYSGESMKPPSYYHEKIKAELGHFYDYLPAKVVDYLRQGEPEPNSRISNMITNEIQADVAQIV
ncbi:MAG: B12-binding domain-containing radical SAM protein [bacterium]